MIPRILTIPKTIACFFELAIPDIHLILTIPRMIPNTSPWSSNMFPRPSEIGLESGLKFEMMSPFWVWTEDIRILSPPHIHSTSPMLTIPLLSPILTPGDKFARAGCRDYLTGASSVAVTHWGVTGKPSPGPHDIRWLPTINIAFAILWRESPFWANTVRIRM